MFQNFTQKSFDVIMAAQEATRSMGHNVVDTEQLLLGILSTNDNEAAKALSELGVSLETAQAEVQNMIGLGTKFSEAEIPFSPQAKRALELAIEEAKKLGDKRIEPRHMLLGVVREGKGFATVIIQKLATTSEILPSLYRALDAAE